MILNLQEAWTDFVYSLHESGAWELLSRPERQYIDKTNRVIKSGGVPLLRVLRLFDKHAPGVYAFKDLCFVKRSAGE